LRKVGVEVSVKEKKAFVFCHGEVPGRAGIYIPCLAENPCITTATAVPASLSRWGDARTKSLLLSVSLGKNPLLIRAVCFQAGRAQVYPFGLRVLYYLLNFLSCNFVIYCRWLHMKSIRRFVMPDLIRHPENGGRP
jgi:hypothetical protein